MLRFTAHIGRKAGRLVLACLIGLVLLCYLSRSRGRGVVTDTRHHGPNGRTDWPRPGLLVSGLLGKCLTEIAHGSRQGLPQLKRMIERGEV